jgi:hypothetical protein
METSRGSGGHNELNTARESSTERIPNFELLGTFQPLEEDFPNS